MKEGSNNKLYCVNCGKELSYNNPICEICDLELGTEKPDNTKVPIVIMILISISLGLFIIWDIVFMDFSGTIVKICEVDFNAIRITYNCNPNNFRGDSNVSYILELISDKAYKIKKINFNEYPILFNKDNYKRLFRKLKRGDFIKKSYFSPYYIVNEDTYVLIGSPLQIILFASLFLILIPIFLPKFVKDFFRDNKHLSKLRVR